MSRYREALAQAGLLYSAAIWGSTFFLVKSALNDISPFSLISFRFLIASFFMLIFLKIKRKKIFKDIKNGIILGGILMLVYFPQTLGLKFTTASNSGFITGLFILFVPITGWIIFKRIPEKRKIFSVMIAVVGLWILTGGLTEINVGDSLTIVTAIAYALHILYVGEFMKKGADPYILTFQQFLFVGLFSLVGTVITESGPSWTKDSVWWIIIFLALFPTLSAFLIQMVSQKFTSSIRVAIIFSLEPVFAAIFAWTIGGEKFLIHRGIGGFIIVLAIIVSELPVPKKK